YKNILSEYAKKGHSYPAAREKAVSSLLGLDISDINTPNNILGIEYITALKRTGSKMAPYTMKREQSSHNDEVLAGEISSGAAVRLAIRSGKIPFEALPENTRADFENMVYPLLDDYSDIFRYIAVSADKEELALIADMTEGLENRFIKYIGLDSITSMIESVKTKRYTYTKLQRAVLHTLLGIKKSMQCEKPRYIRVLGIKKDKKHLLNELGKNAALPVVTSVKENEQLLKNEIKATNIYDLFGSKKTGTEYTAGIVVV
ncbi:MAG: nucleotidyltransferase family protein, partial [Firmicutes bacterium]|nr:nucleotidyltransferase family protein [Bacillota bacterium]